MTDQNHILIANRRHDQANAYCQVLYVPSVNILGPTGDEAKGFLSARSKPNLVSDYRLCFEVQSLSQNLKP